ncbi:hypothetical protein ACP70R_008687 [Stipagrostis hirtigluma subsp. patula]
MARAKSGGSGGAVCLALRIATVALSAASAATMASATQQPTTTAAAARRAPAATASISYSDYSSFRYSLAANVISAALQLAAAWLAARGGGGEGYGKAAKSLAELVDMASKVLLYSSSAVSFAVDDFGTCGRRVAGVCTDAVEFCRRVHGSGALSMAAAVALAVSQYLKDVPVSISFDGDELPPPLARLCNSLGRQSGFGSCEKVLHLEG